MGSDAVDQKMNQDIWFEIINPQHLNIEQNKWLFGSITSIIVEDFEKERLNQG